MIFPVSVLHHKRVLSRVCFLVCFPPLFIKTFLGFFSVYRNIKHYVALLSHILMSIEHTTLPTPFYRSVFQCSATIEALFSEPLMEFFLLLSSAQHVICPASHSDACIFDNWPALLWLLFHDYSELETLIQTPHSLLYNCSTTGEFLVMWPPY